MHTTGGFSPVSNQHDGDKGIRSKWRFQDHHICRKDPDQLSMISFKAQRKWRTLWGVRVPEWCLFLIFALLILTCECANGSRTRLYSGCWCSWRQRGGIFVRADRLTLPVLADVIGGSIAVRQTGRYVGPEVRRTADPPPSDRQVV